MATWAHPVAVSAPGAGRREVESPRSLKVRHARRAQKKPLQVLVNAHPGHPPFGLIMRAGVRLAPGAVGHALSVAGGGGDLLFVRLWRIAKLPR